MAEVLSGIVGEILKSLGSRALENIASAWGFKDQLEELKMTIDTIRDLLLYAEETQAEDTAVRNWLARLTTAVYAADDLFDEFNTIASMRQLRGGNKVTREVRTFFSGHNQIVFAFKLSRKIKAMKEKLEAIVNVGSNLGLAQHALQQGRVKAETIKDQTHSYVEVEGVIGRDEDKKAILNLLIPSSEDDNDEVISVLPIVGMGGMGKTTIAKVIYNDPLVDGYFDLKLWVCVSDDFDMQLIIEKILRSASDSETPKLDMEQLQRRLREKIGGKRYLLVLDDVWEENANKWESLKVLLKVGRKGSKILVTTRSVVVARVMGTLSSHTLEGLSDEMSWDLFEKTAFESGEAQHKPHLVSLGKQIVTKCANVPLAIVTLGRLCRCEDESKWLEFKDKNLSEVMNILKLSYQHLPAPLKTCFSYCALFPKDSTLRKERLIELWIAEGFIINNANENKSLEDVAEEYVLYLLQRGFFQNAIRNDKGYILSCMMHDLMHDLAQEEAKGFCKLAKCSQNDFEDTILHLSFADPLYSYLEFPNEILDLKMLRTFLMTQDVSIGLPDTICQQLVTKLLHLRVLDLHGFTYESLPRSIDNLIHLRYLNLSNSRIISLPGSITNLYNLQTLNLSRCELLRTLPSNIHKLVNLKSLNISLCPEFTHMPSGIRRLTALHKLPVFIVGHNYSAKLRKKPLSTAKLSDLKKLNNLRGLLQIHIHRSSTSVMIEAMEADITSKHRLTELVVGFDTKVAPEVNTKIYDEAVLESLKPHCNLKRIYIYDYGGRKLPSWAVKDNLGQSVPNLDTIVLQNWSKCEKLPSLSQLRFLNKLILYNMERVEYIESSVLENIFFPSLELLQIEDMINLKGWWKEVEASASNDDTKVRASGRQHHDHLLRTQFSNLKSLTINNCPKLMNLPLFPNVKKLSVLDTNKKLLSFIRQASISSATASTSSSSAGLKLEALETDDVEYLIFLSQRGLDQLSELYLWDDKLQSTEVLGEIFRSISSSLRLLYLRCKSLRSIFEGLEHLTRLENLTISNCEELDVSANEGADAIVDMPWKAFSSLRELHLISMPKLESLPNGIQHLTNLRTLKLERLLKLREVPEWISCLSSLQELKLKECPKLKSLPEGLIKLTSSSSRLSRTEEADFELAAL